MHAFFRDSNKRSSSDEDAIDGGDGGGGGGGGANSGVNNLDVAENGEDVSEVVNFCDFVRVLAHFRPVKKKPEKYKMNTREEKLKCESNVQCTTVEHVPPILIPLEPH